MERCSVAVVCFVLLGPRLDEPDTCPLHILVAYCGCNPHPIQCMNEAYSNLQALLTVRTSDIGLLACAVIRMARTASADQSVQLAQVYGSNMAYHPVCALRLPHVACTPHSNVRTAASPTFRHRTWLRYTHSQAKRKGTPSLPHISD